MRRFKFHLEAVAKHRSIIEALRLHEFVMAQGRVQESRTRIEAIRADLGAAPVSASPAAMLDDRRQWDAYLERRFLDLDLELGFRSELELRMNTAREALLAANRASESIQQIRTRAIEKHRLDEISEEQADLDDIVRTRAA